MRPIIIGITGGIGGGKSLFSKHLMLQGQLVYNADSETKKLQDSDSDLRKQIQAAFGNDIYTPTGLDRTRLAKMVFADTAQLQKLNAIVHPAVIAHFRQWMERNKERTYLFIESAILFEARIDTLVDKVVVITAPDAIRIARVTMRDGVSADAVKARMRHQMKEHEKIARADWVFDTSDNKEPHERVKQFLTLLAQSQKPT